MAHGPEGPPLDRTFLNTRREAATVFALWVVAFLWVVPYCTWKGYDASAPLETVWGVPSWVFWGIAVPWGLTSAFALWFSLRRMTDDDLGQNPDEGAAEGAAAGESHP